VPERYPCEHVVPIDEEPQHHLMLRNTYVRGFAVEVGRRRRTLCHRHAHDYLLYVAIGGEIVSAVAGEEPERLWYRDGECELGHAGLVHVVENPGNMPFRNIVIELLPEISNLQRGEKPGLFERVREGVLLVPPTPIKLLSPLLTEARAAVFEFEINNAMHIDVPGPAVIAVPNGGWVRLTSYEGECETGLPPEHLDFPKLVWVRPGWKIRGFGVARGVIFQVGSIDDEFSAVPKTRHPLKRLHAYGDEPES
jgi:hypothetical protein